MTVEEIRRHPDYKGAKCARNKLCDLNVVFQNHEIQIDRCSFCAKEIHYRIVNGKKDEAKYGRDHVRDILQPGGSAYEEIYGSGWRKRRRYRKGAPTQKEMYEEAMDMAKTLERLESKGYHLLKDKIF